MARQSDDRPTLTGIDHFVLTVEDVERTCEFYAALGAEIQTFGDGRKAVRFGAQKINLHPVDNDVDHVAAAPTPGAGDFCLLTETPISAVVEHLRDRGIDLVAGPVERTGAVGTLTSVYVRDPDDNLVEFARYDDGDTPAAE